MDRIERSKKGGKINAELSKKKALDRYYKDPNHCLKCGDIIQVKEGKKVSTARVKKFCSRRCSAIYNNKKYPKKTRTAMPSGPCEKCGVAVFYTKGSNGSYVSRKYCSSCNRIVRAHSLTKTYYGKKHEGKLGLIENLTKDELRARYGNYSGYRHAVCRNSRSVYIKSGNPLVCFKCSYSAHVDICHKKEVADFSGDTKIKMINDLGNLVALCKNHHWEYDNGLLKL